MIDYKVVLLISSIVALCLVFNYLDAKYRFSFTKWVGGEVGNPFVSGFVSENDSAQTSSLVSGESCREKSENERLRKEVEGLKERVQVLEKIVTEPAYELKQAFRKL